MRQREGFRSRRSLRWSGGPVWVLVLLAVVLSGPGCRRDSAPATPADPLRPKRPAPNIIMIMIDTLRADRLSCYGHPGGLCPTLEAIAAEGVTFDQVIAPSPWTQPSMASLFTSLYPDAHKVDLNLYGMPLALQNHPFLPKLNFDLVTLPELLQKRNYVTAGFIANPLLAERYGFGQGFDHYDVSFAKNSTPGSVVNEAAEKWLRERKMEKPFFLYLHYMDVHSPYDAPPEFMDPLMDKVESLPVKRAFQVDELPALANAVEKMKAIPDRHTNPDRHNRLAQYHEYWAARYDAGLVEFDHHLADLQRRLRDLQLWEDAYLVIVSDHGEALGEHGHWVHGQSAHHPELHVPVIFRWKGVLPTGRHVAPTASLIDVLPTMFDQLNFPVPGAIQGQSLLRYLGRDEPVDSEEVFAAGVLYGPKQRAVYADGWKLLHDVEASKTMLYDVTRDPLEQKDLAADHPDRVARLSALLAAQAEVDLKYAAGAKTKTEPVTDEERERLKALGYTN